MGPKKPTTTRPKPKATSTTTLESPLKQPLLAWFKANKITYDPHLLTIHCDPTTHEFCITSGKVPVKKDTVVATIPKTACLSAKNSAIAGLIDEENLVGTLALTLALLFERSLVAQNKPSPFSAYIRSLPQHAPTPLFWSETDAQLLDPTDTPYAAYKRSLEEDFDEIVAPFIHAHTPLLFPEGRGDEEWRKEFLQCSSLVTSRAFHMDVYHGDGLVPLADLFNHKSGGEHVHVEGDGDVCVFCGAVEGGCDCLWSDDEEEEGGHVHDAEGGCCGEEHEEDGEGEKPMTEEELKGLSIKELKFILKQIGVDSSECLYKQDLVAKVLESYNDAAGEEGEEWEDESEDGHEPEWLFQLEEEVPELVDTAAGGAAKKGKKPSAFKSHLQEEEEGEEVEDSLEITIVRAAKPHSELFNIYGDHTNAKLLNLYGFAEMENPNNHVQVDVEYLLETVGSIVGEKQMMERSGFWKEVGRKVVDLALHGQDGDESDEDWSDDEEHEHEHGDDCHHDDDDDDDESTSAHDDLKDNDSLHFTNSGEASQELIAFLHLLLLDSKAFQAFTKDEETVKKYIGEIIEKGLDSWTATSVGGGKKKGNVKATEKPIAQQIHAILNSVAAQRLSRYALTDGEAELAELQEMINKKDFGPRRWALTVRCEERRILNAAFEEYRK
ncbi:hypothetical protein HDU98_008586 [Podochytrium sp. JEL0797]|nr:hypothetical protein HDU98_008586 [Podochytrium sp. JEL0797]